MFYNQLTSGKSSIFEKLNHVFENYEKKPVPRQALKPEPLQLLQLSVRRTSALKGIDHPGERRKIGKMGNVDSGMKVN
jgi:hypothetical protein